MFFLFDNLAHLNLSHVSPPCRSLPKVLNGRSIKRPIRMLVTRRQRQPQSRSTMRRRRSMRTKGKRRRKLNQPCRKHWLLKILQRRHRRMPSMSVGMSLSTLVDRAEMFFFSKKGGKVPHLPVFLPLTEKCVRAYLRYAAVFLPPIQVCHFHGHVSRFENQIRDKFAFTRSPITRSVKVYRASSLSRTHLSAYLEERVRNRLTELGEGAAAKSITVRLLSNVYVRSVNESVLRLEQSAL